MRNNHGTLRLFALLTLLFALTGCPGVQYEETNEELGKVSWANLQDHNAKALKESAPYSASLSFRLKTPKEGFMLGAYVWSNAGPRGHHPLRLDLQSSVGSSVAKMLEESDYFLVYDIKNDSAVVSRSPQEALATLGLPLPFSLGDMSMLMNGRYLDFFTCGDNTRPQLVATTQEQRSVFEITGGSRMGYLTVNSRGYPLEWREHDEKNGWSMKISYQDAASLMANVTPLPGPSRIILEHPHGYSININVKSLKKLPAPFTAKQLELVLPPSASARELTEQPKGK